MRDQAAFNRMDSLTATCDKEAFLRAITVITNELVREGFEPSDASDYMTHIINDRIVDKTKASTTYWTRANGTI